MTKKILFALGAAAMLTACSQEEVLDINNEANAIKVGVDVSGASRASDSYCPEVLPQNFFLSAVTPEGTIYFLNDPMTKTSTSNKYNFDNGVRYWTDSTLDFFAWHCTQTGVNFQLTKNEDGKYQGSFVDFTVADQVKDQADLLFAKTDTAAVGKEVPLKFRHALSQVAFKAKCENATINIDIKGVGLYGLYNKGTFVWTGNTNTMLAQANQGNQGVLDLLSAGETTEEKTPDYTWEVADGATTTSYFVTLGETKTVNSESGTVVLTSAPSDHTNKAGWANVFQVLPQCYYAESNIRDAESEIRDTNSKAIVIRHNINAGNAPQYVGIPELKSEAYIMLQCEISTTNADGEKVVLYAAENAEGQAQYVYIPIQFAWLPGYRYIYTINFAANGSGGIIDPTPGPDPVDPVLKKIIVSGTVVEYNEDESENNFVTADQTTQGVLTLLQ